MRTYVRSNENGKQMYKFLILQTIGAIFGYIWILSIPTSIFLVVMAIFFGWSWTNLIVVLVCGGIAKMLLRGFRDTAERLKLEHFLVNKHGYTLQQARKFWETAYGDGGGDGYLRVLEVYGLTDEQLSTSKALMP